NCGISRRGTGTDKRMLPPEETDPSTASASQAGATSATYRSDAPVVRDDENRALGWRKPISDALSVRTYLYPRAGTTRRRSTFFAIPRPRPMALPAAAGLVDRPLSRRRRPSEPQDTVTVKALLVLPWNTEEPSYWASNVKLPRPKNATVNVASATPLTTITV